MDIQAPVGDSTVLQTLPAYYQYLLEGEFSKYAPDDFTGDLKKFGVFTREKAIKGITDKDIHAWVSLLKTPVPKGEGLSAKTVSRKLSASSNYFSWLVGIGVLDDKHNSMWEIKNTRISSPLPEILFEIECKNLLTAASSDPRTYLLFSLLPETGIKLECSGSRFRILIFRISIVLRCTYGTRGRKKEVTKTQSACRVGSCLLRLCGTIYDR